MKYTLICKDGKVRQFYIEGVARMYQGILGGVLMTEQILETTEDNTIPVTI